MSASLACVAGCATSDDTTPGGETITDPATVTVRNPGSQRAVTTRRTDSIVIEELIRTRPAADDLSTTADTPPSEQTAFESFLANTSFDNETVYVTQSQPKSCREYRVQSLYWSPRWIELDYCKRLRPPDASCATDRRDAVAILVRIPGEVSRDPTIRTGSDTSCPDPEYAVIDETATNQTATNAMATNRTATNATTTSPTDSARGGDT